MLVLARNVDETILLTGDMLSHPIEIKVLRTSDNRLRLGINAPADVRILRGELFRDQGENYGREETANNV